MKIYIESETPYTARMIELDVTEDETVGSIRDKIAEDNIKSYIYKDCESDFITTRQSEYNNVVLGFESVGKWGGRSPQDWILQVNEKSLKDCLGERWQSGLKIFQNYKYTSSGAKFVCSAPNVKFEFKGEYPKCGDSMKDVRESFVNTFGSNCTISLRKIKTAEYYTLKDSDPLPCKNEIIFVQFEQSVNLEDKMRISFAGYDILKLTWHTPPKKVWQFEDATQKPHSKGLHTISHRYFIATGGLCGLFSAITTSYLLRNPLTETAMQSLVPKVLVAAVALGASVGSLLGYAASYVYEYYNTPDSNSSKTLK